MPRAYWLVDPKILNPKTREGMEFHETIPKQWSCPNLHAGSYKPWECKSKDYKPLVIRVLGGQRLLELPTQAARRGTYPVCQTCPNQLSCMASDVDHNYKLYLTKAQRGMSPHPLRTKT